ncbi:hypothetical protein BO99DRAFT_60968 [Aspergillus violaceofuscus CBS 115571]|uniref:Uncharacterized protein n=1 Tax=Aspergillus violaceofuscus (strain CBS 115571) TaxID=1450538 RepID=A0A2V5HBD5_ASPV1|nr:hypothetical protein BO99DRAFT_60968 [Aspergillus violaceofuscus CBS 115571]
MQERRFTNTHSRNYRRQQQPKQQRSKSPSPRKDRDKFRATPPHADCDRPLYPPRAVIIQREHQGGTRSKHSSKSSHRYGISEVDSCIRSAVHCPLRQPPIEILEGPIATYFHTPSDPVIVSPYSVTPFQASALSYAPKRKIVPKSLATTTKETQLPIAAIVLGNLPSRPYRM